MTHASISTAIYAEKSSLTGGETTDFPAFCGDRSALCCHKPVTPAGHNVINRLIDPRQMGNTMLQSSITRDISYASSARTRSGARLRVVAACVLVIGPLLAAFFVVPHGQGSVAWLSLLALAVPPEVLAKL